MSVELHNIPAVWTALFHWQSCLMYVSLLPLRRGKRACAATALVLLLVEIPYMAVIAPLDGLPFNVGMLGFAGLTLLPFLLLCKGAYWSHFYHCARAFILGGFTVSLAWQLYIYYAPRFVWLASSWAEAVFMLALGLVVYAAMWLLERNHRREMQELTVSRLTCFGAVAVAFIIYILSSLSYATVETPFAAAVEADAFTIRTIAYLGGVAILYAYHLQLCEFHAAREVNALQTVLDLQYTNYQRSQESIDMVNRTYHDLKHQITALRADLGAEQKLECLDQIEQNIRAYESQNQTGNKVVDAILMAKTSYCLDHGITLTSMVDGEALAFMGTVDVSALFGNALDNAIEGVSKLSAPEQRFIRLAVTQQKGVFVHQGRKPLSGQPGGPGGTAPDHQGGQDAPRLRSEEYPRHCGTVWRLCHGPGGEGLVYLGHCHTHPCRTNDGIIWKPRIFGQSAKYPMSLTQR